MPTAQAPPPIVSAGLDLPTPLTSAVLAHMDDVALMDEAAATSRQLAALAGRFMALTAELDRREGWRAEGATSLEAWMAERCGLAPSTARSYARVGERLFDLPHLAGALAEGTLSFDKVRVLAPAARPETEGTLVEVARTSSVRELAEVARSASPPTAAQSQKDHESRSVRFNDACSTMTATLAPEAYAEVRACLEAKARSDARDDTQPDAVTQPLRLDQRLADALVDTLRAGSRGQTTSSSPYLVVAHVPLAVLTDDATDDASDPVLFGELEGGGLINAEVVRRLACDATVIVALDDDVGHTLYEGRSRRDPSPTQRREIQRRDRHCRFPGCANATFTNAHHIEPWTPRGPTDIDNLALLCVHHHARIHAKEWTMRGNANEELTFVGPSGRVMTSRPSPLWTRASTQAARRNQKK
ncbi:MAG TPA: DUF222 domain-containing protein [Acidimicrobiales bacterium]|nr:DUF222 domain-containing protein [Acidimicrobiales bacterium]